MPTDINLLTDSVSVTGDTVVNGKLRIVGAGVSEGAKKGVALAHVSGDILKVNLNKTYEGGVSVDGAVAIGGVKIAPEAYSTATGPTPVKFFYTAKIYPNTILFETSSAFAPGGVGKPIVLDLIATINQLKADVEALKKAVAAL